MLVYQSGVPKSMHNRLRFLRKAESDVAEILSYLADESPVLAWKFRAALQSTGELLLGMPRIGSVRIFHRPLLADIRILPVRDFEKYIVFYHPLDDGIEIVRVLHGARDYPALF